MTPDEQKAILWAHQDAYAYILGALKGLEKVTESADTQLYGNGLNRVLSWVGAQAGKSVSPSSKRTSPAWYLDVDLLCQVQKN